MKYFKIYDKNGDKVKKKNNNVLDLLLCKVCEFWGCERLPLCILEEFSKW